MKLITSALMCLLLFFMSSCSDENEFSEPSLETASLGVRFYGVKSVDDSQTKGVAQKSKLWYNGTVISIKFLNGSGELQEKVKAYAAEWQEYANIEFDYVTEGDALVRIGFNHNDDRYISWSYTGTDCRYEKDQSKATLNFFDLDYLSESDQNGEVLRMFGMVLGLELEHRHLDYNPDWRRDIKRYWTGEIYDIPWDELAKYVFDPLAGKNVEQTTAYDAQSIMVWPFPSSYLQNSSGNPILSEQDKTFIAGLYPKAESSPKATVFTFSRKVEFPVSEVLVEGDVKIVVDGELAYQGDVASAPAKLDGMVFSIETKKMKIYVFNNLMSSIIGNIEKLHLVDIEYTSFLLYSAYALKELTLDGIPYFSQSNLEWAFFRCSSLTSIPEGLFDNCPQVTSFDRAFTECQSLKSIPKRLFDNCPKVTNFNHTFGHCFSLTSIPDGLFDNNPNVITSVSTFSWCDSLTNIPAGLFNNWSKVEELHWVFANCTALTSIPKGLFDNCPEVTNFNHTFSSCSSLTVLPAGLFDNCPEVESFQSTFGWCSSLTSIPDGLFDNCTKVANFWYTFDGCSSITSAVPELWKTYPNAEQSLCFSGCTQASNYADIPDDWK